MSLLHFMAASSKGQVIAGNFGKRFMNPILPSTPAIPSSSSRMAVHVSSYDKNIEEQVRPVIAPDNVIDANSDKYWGPHPKTGIYTPADPTTSIGSGQLNTGAGNQVTACYSVRAEY